MFPWFSEVAVSDLEHLARAQRVQVPPALSGHVYTQGSTAGDTVAPRPWEEAEHRGPRERNLIFRVTFNFLNCVSMLLKKEV